MALSSDLWRPIALAAISAGLFLSFLGQRDIWDIDEGMHAAMAQTMVRTGDWVTPVNNGEAFLDKPVLFNWLTAISFKLFGFSETAARLPAALSALLCVMLTWQLGKRLHDEETGFLAGIVLATSLEFLILARVVQYDIVFTLFTTLALLCFVSAVRDEGRQRRYFFGLYVAVALAVLTKGPIGAVLPGIVIVGYLVTTGKWSLLRRMHLVTGTLLFLVIAAPWYVLMEQANPGYLHYFFVKQHLINFLGSDGTLKPRHPEPFYYYVPVLFAGLLPWSAALPQAIVRGWTVDGEKFQALNRFLVLWVVLVLAFFSAATSKLSTYVLPLLPACAVLIARYLTAAIRHPDERQRRGLVIGMSCWLVPVLLLSVYSIAEDPWTYWQHRSGIEWGDFELFLVLFCLLLTATLALFVFSRFRAAVVAMAITAPVLWFFVLLVIVPGVNPYKGSKELSLQIDYLLNDGQPIPMYGQLLDSAFFYTGRRGRLLQTEEELYGFLDSPTRRYVLMRSRARTEDETFRGNYFIIARLGNKAIVSNQPATIP